MDEKLQELLNLNLNDINSVASDNYNHVLKFLEHNAAESFKRSEGEVAPLEYLSTHLVSKYAEIKAKRPAAQWLYQFLALRVRSGKVMGFSFMTRAMDASGEVFYGDMHTLLLEDDKFTMLQVPYFMSGFAGRFASDLAQEQSNSTKQ